MADMYIPIFYDWLKTTRNLSAEEKGRLIDALVRYAETGEDQDDQLTGNECFVFPFMQAQIDRSKQIRSKRAENGSRGGTTRAVNAGQNVAGTSKAKHAQADDALLEQQKAEPSKSKQSQAKVSKAKQSQATSSKVKQTQANLSEEEKEKEEYKAKEEYEEEYEDIRTQQVISNTDDDDVSNSVRAREDTDVVVVNGGRPDKNTVESYADVNLAHMTLHNFDEMHTFIDDFNARGAPGEEFVRTAIDQACASGNGTWLYVRSVLNAYLAKGFKSVADIQLHEQKRRENAAQKAQKQRASPSQMNDPTGEYQRALRNWH